MLWTDDRIVQWSLKELLSKLLWRSNATLEKKIEKAGKSHKRHIMSSYFVFAMKICIVSCCFESLKVGKGKNKKWKKMGPFFCYHIDIANWYGN